ncbi:hypothetical protein ACIQMY_25440 [Streptomyces sp. NPDC091368]|uniref:hypothetical protein n=1 Tax=Streptomyces sp. NPDC091368 TaxID=3365993 RepID=UPI00382EC3BD
MAFEYRNPTNGDRLTSGQPDADVWLKTSVKGALVPPDRVEEVIAGIRDAARQTTGQADTEACVDCEHPKKLHNQRGCKGHGGWPEEGCTCPLTHTGSTACKGATVCGEDDEPCDQHEREQAHAEGEHAFCGEECECSCASAGPAFAPAGHYLDCPQHEHPAPAVGQPAEAHATDEAEPLVHVGWWCWRGDNHGHLATQACRSDNVPIHVPTEWADDMRAVIQRIEDGDEPETAGAGS